MLSKYLVQALAVSGLAFAQSCKFSSNVATFLLFDMRPNIVAEIYDLTPTCVRTFADLVLLHSQPLR